MRTARLLRAAAMVLAAVATALQPVYGRHAWYVAIVAASSALALVAPSLIPTVRATSSSSPTSPAGGPK